jgi:replication factor A1
VGVIVDAGFVESIPLKNGSSKEKRSIVLADDSENTISVAIWGNNASSQKFEVGTLIAFKSCRISDFNGKSLNSSYSTRDMIVNP